MKIVKKVLSLLASSLAVLIFSGFLSLQPISEPTALAHHDDLLQPCNDIFMVPVGRTETDPVPAPSSPGRRADIPDSGTLDFDALDHAYQACVETSRRERTFSGTTVTGNFIAGWVWNTNLGNISFSCEGGNNFGTGNCGIIDYGTVISETGGPGDDSRRVQGFAWGDNIGWISMGCRNGNNEGVACGDQDGDGQITTPAEQSVNYGVHIMQAGDVVNPDCAAADEAGDMYGFAWTDTVGWINFCGAHAEVSSGLTATIEFPTLNATKYANGSDAYEIVVRVTENDGTLIDPTKYEVTITPAWMDHVRSDQVTLCPDGTDTGCPADRFDATAKGTFSWETGRGFVASIRSLAPTISTDELRLETLTVTAREIRGGGPPVAVTQPVFSSTPLAFQPSVSVTRIYSPDSTTASAGTDSLFAQRNIPTDHLISAAFYWGSGPGALTASSGAKIYTQVHDCSDAFQFVFDEQSNGVGVTDSSGTTIDVANTGIATDQGNIDRPRVVCPLRTSSIADIDGTGEGTLVTDFPLVGDAYAVHRFIYTQVENAALAGTNVEIENALGIRTRVKYTVGPVAVQYFSKLLTDSSLLNQTADVKGNVRIDVQNLGGLLGGRSEKSIGAGAGGAGASKAEFFNRALDNLKWTGLAQPLASDVFDDLYLDNDRNFTNGVKFFRRNIAELGGDTEPCKIILRDDIDFSGKKTIASRGCDVYIESNIYPMADGTLGIVALEDLDMPKDAPRKGGNVYICAAVTDLKNVHIVAENSVLPYGANENDCGTLDERIEQSGPRAGLPNFTNPDSSGVEVKPIRETLKNQLVITGSIVSNNTSGGAFKSPPEAGDGRRITNAELMDTARFYDYNFFRYAHTVTNPNGRAVAFIPKCWSDNIKKSNQFNPYFCSNNNPSPNNAANDNPGSKGIMNIQFAPPPNDLPVFNYKGR